MLQVRDLHVYYDKIHAIKGVDFDVKPGEIVSLIGANGAGKTTILHTISGILKPTEGFVKFQGEAISKLPAHRIVYMGMAHVPEGRRIFAQMTVLENLQMGAFTRKDTVQIRRDMEKIFTRFPRLKERMSQLAGTLSGGEQQMLAMGRALMSNPSLILLDEPSMGLAPILVDQIFSIIEDIKAMGTTVLLVEQNATRALSIADRAYVLETGKIVMSGDAKELLANADVRSAYLGG